MAKSGSKAARFIAVLIAALIGIAIGVGLVLIAGTTLTDWVIKILFIVLGIFILISAIPGTITAFKNVKKKNGVLNLVFSIISLLIGFVLIFDQQWISILVAIYLLVFPIIRIILAKNTFAQARREAPLMILGVVVMIFGFGGTVNGIFLVAGWVIIGLSALYLLLGSLNALKK